MSSIVDPNTYPFRKVGHSRLLTDHLGVVDMTLRDPITPNRTWTVQGVYLPVKREMGGIRLRLTDSKNFVTYLNQRDAEVLLDFATFGSVCSWSSTRYLSPSDASFWGLCMSPEEQRDELYAQEVLLRMALQRKGQDPILANNTEIDVRMHIAPRQDVRKVFRFLGDFNPETRDSPDVTFERIDRRWVEVGTYNCSWETT